MTPTATEGRRMRLFDALQFDDRGLIPAIIADAEDNRPLTLCYLNREALQKTLDTGRVHVFRRSHGRLMMKGETSGHVQEVRRIFVDCEGKSLMILVRQHVAACHKGYRSCYFREYVAEDDSFRVSEEPLFDPKSAYEE